MTCCLLAMCGGLLPLAAQQIAVNKDNRTKSAASFSKLWDNGRFDRVRAGDGAAKYHGRRLALHLMVQPIIAESVLSDDVLTGQGFLARCLLAWPASTIDTFQWERDLPEGNAFGMRSWRKVTKEAAGVVGAIVPWNFPFEVTLQKVGQALATGNTIIVKPAPDTPWNATRLGRLVAGQTDEADGDGGGVCRLGRGPPVK